jgi:hypothetical protein
MDHTLELNSKAYLRARGMGDEQMKTWLAANMVFIDGAFAAHFGVANCDEFAAMVLSNIKRTAVPAGQEQYVYKASMTGMTKTYDHQFVITYNREITNLRQITNYEDATVSDAWQGYDVMSLKRFMDKNNPYRDTLYWWNITLGPAHRANGVDPLNNPDVGDFTAQVLTPLFAELRADLTARRAALTGEANNIRDRAHINPNMFSIAVDHSRTHDHRSFDALLTHRSVPDQVLAVNNWWANITPAVLSKLSQPAQTQFITHTVLARLDAASPAKVREFLKLPGLTIHVRSNYIRTLADAGTAFACLNDIPPAQIRPYLLRLEGDRLAAYINGYPFNRGMLTNVFRQKANLVSRLTDPGVIRTTLDLLSATDKRNILAHLPANQRAGVQAEEAELAALEAME